MSADAHPELFETDFSEFLLELTQTEKIKEDSSNKSDNSQKKISEWLSIAQTNPESTYVTYKAVDRPKTDPTELKFIQKECHTCLS